MLKVFRHTVKIKKNTQQQRNKTKQKKNNKGKNIKKKQPQRKTPPNIINAYHCVHT